jgi:sec-independent protein translocase protein TatA
MIGDILQPTHLLFVLVVALLVLGPKRLPEAGRALGKGLRDFRSAIGGEDDHHNSIPTQTAAPAPAPTFETVAATAPAPQPVQATAVTDGPAAQTADQPAEAAHPFV